MVTQDGHHSISLIIRVEFFLNSGIFELLFIKLFLESD
jgi:hypothetical protein